MTKQNAIMLDNILFAAVASGIKNQNAKNKLDLALVLLPENTTTAAVFTNNTMCAAPVVIAKQHIANKVRAFIINSGNANAGTGLVSGEAGFDNALKICQMVADKTGINVTQVLPFSTGVVGEQLPMTNFQKSIAKMIEQADVKNLAQVSKAIMTTDTVNKIVQKHVIINNKKVNIIGIAKGSGMINPNMATMLSFIFTDIMATKSELQQALNIAVNKSFNRITIDGDTSTNDSCTLSATGVSGVNICNKFQLALNNLATELAKKIVQDGEGATKFITITVEAKNSQNALQVAYAVANSPLVKTAFFASDPNWGRILVAIGNSKVKDIRLNMVSIYLGDVCIIDQGKISKTYTEQQGVHQMQQRAITVNIIVGKGVKETIWTSDLSYDYIRINADYRS